MCYYVAHSSYDCAHYAGCDDGCWIGHENKAEDIANFFYGAGYSEGELSACGYSGEI